MQYSQITIALMALGLNALAGTDDLTGRWAATLKSNSGVEIPFRLDITQKGNQVVGTLYNGRDPKTTSSATIKNGKVELNYEHYLTSIRAEVGEPGELDGQIVSLSKPDAKGPQGNQQYAGTEGRGAEVRRIYAATAFHAKRYTAPTVRAAVSAPKIAGTWEVAQETPKGEKAWRLIVEQNGGDSSDDSAH